MHANDIMTQFRNRVDLNPHNAPATKQSNETSTGGADFQSILDQTISHDTSVAFSKHAQTRMEERDISLSEADMDKLNDAVQRADDKGIKDLLVLLNQNAFIVNVPNTTVITAMKDQDMQGNIFTNINGTVII